MDDTAARQDLNALAASLTSELKAQGKTAATAESLTGGLVAQSITSVPGASEVFGYGFVTYAAQAKTQLLDVPPALIERCNVVSAPVARAMAEGAARHSGADLALALTGLAGPDGGTPERPVGRVYIAALLDGQCRVYEMSYGPRSRQQIRALAAGDALRAGLALLQGGEAQLAAGTPV